MHLQNNLQAEASKPATRQKANETLALYDHAMLLHD